LQILGKGNVATHAQTANKISYFLAKRKKRAFYWMKQEKSELMIMNHAKQN